ncbi:hypothetical protein GVAV_003157 [Gurleya vavrai]
MEDNVCYNLFDIKNLIGADVQESTVWRWLKSLTLRTKYAGPYQKIETAMM